jgi:hypothetical protein
LAMIFQKIDDVILAIQRPALGSGVHRSMRRVGNDEIQSWPG